MFVSTAWYCNLKLTISRLVQYVILWRRRLEQLLQLFYSVHVYSKMGNVAPHALVTRWSPRYHKAERFRPLKFRYEPRILISGATFLPSLKLRWNSCNLAISITGLVENFLITQVVARMYRVLSVQDLGNSIEWTFKIRPDVGSSTIMVLRTPGLAGKGKGTWAAGTFQEPSNFGNISMLTTPGHYPVSDCTVRLGCWPRGAI